MAFALSRTGSMPRLKDSGGEGTTDSDDDVIWHPFVATDG